MTAEFRANLYGGNCEAAKAAPAPPIPTRYEGGCTRCGEAVAPGEGTLRRLDYTWGQLAHDAPTRRHPAPFERE